MSSFISLPWFTVVRPQLEAVWWSPRQVHPVDKKIYYQDGGFNEVRVRQPLSEVMPWLLYDVRAAAAE